jgi:hypothetical protein
MEWRSVCLRDIAHQLMVTGCGRVHLDPTAYSRMPQSDTFPSTRGFSRHTCPHPHMDMLVPARRGSGERSRRGAMPEYRREEERIRCMCTGYSCLQCLENSTPVGPGQRQSIATVLRVTPADSGHLPPPMRDGRSPAHVSVVRAWPCSGRPLGRRPSATRDPPKRRNETSKRVQLELLRTAVVRLRAVALQL